MKLDLSGRRALVTGSTAGIGLAIARAFVACGAEVVVNGREASAVAEAAAAVGAVRGICADVGAPAGVASLVSLCGDVDLLVCNAAVYRRRPFAEISDAEWGEFLDV